MSELKATFIDLLKEFLRMQMREFSGTIKPMAKANLLKIYVTGIQFLWWSALWIVGLIVLLAIFVAGLVGLHVGVLGGFPLPEHFRGPCFLALVIADFAFVAGMVSWLFSQGRWMRGFGAERMIDELVKERVKRT